MPAEGSSECSLIREQSSQQPMKLPGRGNESHAGQTQQHPWLARFTSSGRNTVIATPKAELQGSQKRAAQLQELMPSRKTKVRAFSSATYGPQGWGLSGKESTYSAGDMEDMGSVPRSGRSPGQGNSNSFLPRKSHGQRILEGCSPWGHKTVRHT